MFGEAQLLRHVLSASPSLTWHLLNEELEHPDKGRLSCSFVQVIRSIGWQQGVDVAEKAGLSEFGKHSHFRVRARDGVTTDVQIPSEDRDGALDVEVGKNR